MLDKSKYEILIVDDDSISLTQTRLDLQECGFRVDTASNADHVLQKIKEDYSRYAAIVLDYGMPQKNGAALALEISSLNLGIGIVMYSCDISREALKESLRTRAAVDWVDKGEDISALVTALEGWCRKYEEVYQVLHPSKNPSKNEQLVASIGMVGCSSALVAVVNSVRTFRNSDSDVLILGETGVGKELVAKALHVGDSKLFTVINCGHYAEQCQLLQSELFGHEKGAFTGATTAKAGRVETVRGGTFFLDEFHLLSKAAQAQLLRAIGEKKGIRVGGSHEYSIECRFILAAKPDIRDRVDKGEMLEDIYYRLKKMFSVAIPPLRERKEDIPLLINHFANLFYNGRTGPRKRFMMRTVRRMQKYSWPGNVRELDGVVQHLLTQEMPDKCITPDQLPKDFFENADAERVNGSANGSAATYSELKRRLQDVERKHINEIIKATSSKSDAAKKLDVGLSTFLAILKRLEIRYPEQRDGRIER